jgi:hypothetical protein
VTKKKGQIQNNGPAGPLPPGAELLAQWEKEEWEERDRLNRELTALKQEHQLLEDGTWFYLTSPGVDQLKALMNTREDSRDIGPLMKGIALCLDAGEPLPEWVLEGLGEAIEHVKTFEVKSWDEVFGKPHHGRKVSHLRREAELKSLVLDRFRKLKEERAKGDKLAILAQEFNISYSLARSWCYPSKRLSK